MDRVPSCLLESSGFFRSRVIMEKCRDKYRNECCGELSSGAN